MIANDLTTLGCPMTHPSGVQSRAMEPLARSRWNAFRALAVCALASSTAVADPAAQARFHDELARSHYSAGRFEQALREFFLEQRISPNPRISFNIALCFQDLKRGEDAFQFLSEYLASSDADPERRAYAEKAIASLKTSLALLSVRSVPDGANIYVDRRELGGYGVTPKVIAVSAGDHEVWVEREGYRAATTKITARRGEELPVELAPERIIGELSVTSPGSGQVTVRSPAGETVGEGALPFKTNLPPGTYEIGVVSPGHLPWAGVAHVEAGETSSITAVPQETPAPTGSITVTSNVAGALVELNGQPAGFSPTVLSSVKVGAQRLRVTAPSLLPWSGKVDVAAEQRSWLTVSLEEPPSTRVSPATWVVGGIGAAGLVAGGVLAVLAGQAHADFENAPPDTDRTALRDRGVTLNTASDIAFVTGAVVTAAAVVLYFTTKEVRGRPSAASMTRSKP